jgi:hypothetical protein
MHQDTNRHLHAVDTTITQAKAVDAVIHSADEKQLTAGEIICAALQYLPANNPGFWNRCVAEAGMPAKAISVSSYEICAIVGALTDSAIDACIQVRKDSLAA